MTDAVSPILVQAEMPPQASAPTAAAVPAGQGEIQSPELPDICVGCGMHHGSQGAELQCLRSFIGTLRALAARRT